MFEILDAIGGVFLVSHMLIKPRLKALDQAIMKRVKRVKPREEAVLSSGFLF
jgi:hypothetical protein